MQIKLIVKKIVQNEDGTVSTKFAPELIGAVEGAYASGELFITLPNIENQPVEIVYSAELNSDLGEFVEIIEIPEEPIE